MRLGFWISFISVCAAAPGCIDTKDMSASGGSSDDGAATASSTDPTGVGGGTMTSAGTTGGGSASEAGSEEAGSDTATDSDSATTDPTSATATEDSGDGTTASESDTGLDDEALCRQGGGTWDPTACGHYVCGLPNACAAIIPGCDCGFTMNFVEGEGCVQDDECLAVTFACGTAVECLVATEYCEVFHPGVKGSEISHTCNDLPEACISDHSCMCLEDEGGFGNEADCTEENGGGGLTLEVYGA